MSFYTPVAFFIFNRPDLTEIVFEAIAQAKPKKLLVVADGSRFTEEAEKCDMARAVIKNVDWECEVLTNFSSTNMGCKKRVSSGLNWVFSKVEEAIILEDDCLPHPTFFRFCEELLECYRNSEHIMHIAGTNFIPLNDLNVSFIFSRLVPIWGWATWRRAWQRNDIEMKLWPKYKETDALQYFRGQNENVYRVFEDNYHNRIDTWDGQWAFSCVVNESLSIIPKTNLVKNLGFRPDATHTKVESKVTSVPVQGLEFPLFKPSKMTPDRDFDEKFLDFLNGSEKTTNILRRIKNYALKIAKHKMPHNGT